MNRFIVFILAGMMASGALADGHSASGDASAKAPEAIIPASIKTVNRFILFSRKFHADKN